jgi:2-alkyl-3-oxoalkanoate reductase
MVSRVAVTGATGMVGSHLVKHLLQRGYDVVATIRSSSDIRALSALEPAEKLTIKQADLFKQEGLVEAFAGVDVVVHAAGAVNPLAPRKTIYNVNVQGTKIVLAAAQQCGAKQFIHISSLSVITGRSDQYGTKDDAPLLPCGDPYPDSKIEAEKLLCGFDSPEFHITCLRPGFIYGPGEKSWLPRLIQSLKTGRAVLIDGGAKETNLIYVENLCRAIELSILNTTAYGKTYNLTDGQTITKKELFDTVCKQLGYKPIRREVPGAIAWFVCEIASTISPILPLALRQSLMRYSRAAYRLAGLNQGFDISKAENELGYTDRISFHDGMTQTLQKMGLHKNSRTLSLVSESEPELTAVGSSSSAAIVEEGTQA